MTFGKITYETFHTGLSDIYFTNVNSFRLDIHSTCSQIHPILTGHCNIYLTGQVNLCIICHIGQTLDLFDVYGFLSLINSL